MRVTARGCASTAAPALDDYYAAARTPAEELASPGAAVDRPVAAAGGEPFVLVWAPAGTWAVSAGHDPALLGKLYSENVVLVPGGTWGALDAARA